MQSNKNIGWVVTPFYIVIFFLILGLFHPILLLAGSFSRKAHKYLLDRMNYLILLNMRVVAGASITVKNIPKLDSNKPVLLVSNHQSMYDIPLLMWTLRERRVGFVAKKELGRGIPSISYSLRHLDSVLIDRKDSQQALSAIGVWGTKMNEIKGVACIFPEGTRAKRGERKPFKPAGVIKLLESMPDAIIQPVAISGAWEFLQYDFLPVPWGVNISCTFLPVIDQKSSRNNELIMEIEELIAGSLNFTPKGLQAKAQNDKL